MYEGYDSYPKPVTPIERDAHFERIYDTTAALTAADDQLYRANNPLYDEDIITEEAKIQIRLYRNKISQDLRRQIDAIHCFIGSSLMHQIISRIPESLQETFYEAYFNDSTTDQEQTKPIDSQPLEED